VADNLGPVGARQLTRTPEIALNHDGGKFWIAEQAGHGISARNLVLQDANDAMPQQNRRALIGPLVQPFNQLARLLITSLLLPRAASTEIQSPVPAIPPATARSPGHRMVTMAVGPVWRPRRP